VLIFKNDNLMKLKFSLEVKGMKRLLSIKIILLIYLLGTVVFLIGCTPPVSGTVTGVINVYWPNEEVFMPGAAMIGVINEGKWISTVSSFSDGSYTLSNVPTGQHAIIAFKHGYTATQQVINVVEGQTVTNVDFNLETEEPVDRLGGVIYLCFNLDVAPFNNLKIRQAFNYAIDKQTLVDEINSEFGYNLKVAQGLIPPSIMGYTLNLTGYSYDVSEAQRLLSQAGYPEGFNTDLYYNILDSGLNYFFVQKIQTHLAQIGVNVELHGIEWNQLLRMVTAGELSFFRMAWTFDTPDPTDAFYCLYHSTGPDNSSHYHNTTIDSQIEQGWVTMNEGADFILLINKIESTVVDDAPAIYIYHY
jgi:peptide/nickel transport system substrate-binding protein